MSDALRRKAETQDGVVTTLQAIDAGFGRRDLSAMVRVGELVHLGRSLYALPSPGLATDRGRYEALSRGGLVLYPDAALSHATAVLAHGLPLVDARLGRPRLVRPRTCEVLTQSFVLRPRRHETTADSGWGRAVDLAHALVQHTLENGAVAGIVAADAALHDGRLVLEDLEAAAAAVDGWPDSGRVRTALAYVDGRSESPGESRLRVDLTLAGIALVPQAVIRDEHGRFVARVDLLVKETRVVIEFDGLVKYRSDGAQVLVAEKRREDALRRLGYVVVRVTWADLSRPAVMVAEVRRAMELARLVAVTPA